MKLLISSSAKDVAQVALNAYFYSTTYRIREDGIIVFIPAGKNEEEQNKNLQYKVAKNRHKIYHI